MAALVYVCPSVQLSSQLDEGTRGYPITSFAELQYRLKLDDDSDQTNLTVSRIVSGLDLATTTRALRLALEHRDITLNSEQVPSKYTFSCPPRSQYPDKYHSFRSSPLSSIFPPSICAAVTAYEQRTLRPVVLLESRATSIVFDLEGKIPRPVTPVSYNWTKAPDRRIDALDLRGVIAVTLHSNSCWKTVGCKCGTSRTVMKFEDCTRALIRVRLLQARDIKRLRILHFTWFLKSFRWWFPLVGLYLVAVLIWAFVLVACLYFFIINGITGGALLTKIGPHFPSPQLAHSMNRMDKRLCGVVVAGEIPCIISSNPDVAGIGGRIAFYVQAIALITLLTFSPAEADPARWVLATSSLAYGLSALISAGAKQLTLYHMILAAKFQSFPIFLTTIIEPAPPVDHGALYIVNRARWVVNSVIILWYTLTAPCFGAQTVCNVYVLSHSYLHSSPAISMPQRVASLFNVAIPSFLLFPDMGSMLVTGQSVLIMWLIMFLGGFLVPILSIKISNWAQFRSNFDNAILQSTKISNWGQLIFPGPNWVLDNAMPRLHHVGLTSKSLPPPATAAPARKNIFRRIHGHANMIVTNVIIALPYPKFQRYMIALMVACIMIWDIEQMIVANHVAPGENIWTYGQILTFVLAGVPVIQLLQLSGLLGLVKRWLVKPSIITELRRRIKWE